VAKEDQVFATLTKSDDEEIRIFISEYKGKEKIHIRSFYRSPDDPQWKFGKGVVISADDMEGIDTLIEGMNKVKAYLEGVKLDETGQGQ
jgi:hypothetical protein